MERDTAKKFWRTYFKIANNGYADANMPNPAIDFTARAYAGDFDEISDSEYERKSCDMDDLCSFWEGRKMEAAGAVLLKAIEKTDIPDSAIDGISRILADASVRTGYCPQEQELDEGTFQPGLGFPPAYGMKNPVSSPPRNL